MTDLTRFIFGKEAEQQKLYLRKVDGRHWYKAIDIYRILGVIMSEYEISFSFGNRERTDADLEDYEWAVFPYTVEGVGTRSAIYVNDGGLLKIIFSVKTKKSIEYCEPQVKKVPERFIPVEWRPYLKMKWYLNDSV